MSNTKDESQLKLRSKKKAWNLASREFFARLIAFKQGLNGRGSSKYGLPVSNIKDPIPEQTTSFLHELISNFQQLSEAALDIIEQQEQYSEHRRKPQEERAPKIATASTKLPQKQGYLLLADRHVLPTLLAISNEEQEQGLMYIKPPAPTMSFLYDKPRINQFWMKNTPAPLDIVFVCGHKIVDIKKGEPYSTRLIGDYIHSNLVIELPEGTAAKLGLQVGHNASLSMTPLELIAS